MSRELGSPRVLRAWRLHPAREITSRCLGIAFTLSGLMGCAHEAEPARVPDGAFQGPWSPRPYYYVPTGVTGGAQQGSPAGNIPAATHQATHYPQDPATHGASAASAVPAPDPTRGSPLPVPAPPPQSPPALTYASLSPEACANELAARQLPVRRYSPNQATRDVVLPVQLSGALNGVSIVMNGAKAPGTRGDYDVFDCRLALSLDDWTRDLGRRGVRVLRHASLLRPGAVVRRSGRPSQHALGLAIDVASLELQDGTRYEIERDFSGAIGAPVCVEQAEPTARWLRALVCDTHQSRVFNLILTPNYNADHHDHVHLDLEPGKTWFNLH